MNELSAHEVHAEFASFHFQKLVLSLPSTPTEALFDPGAIDSAGSDGVVSTLTPSPSAHFGTLAHEMTHFFQALTTVFGQGVLLNWLGFLGSVADTFQGHDSILLPLSKYPFRRPKQNALLADWDAYISESNCLVGAKAPPLSGASLAQASEYDFVEYKYAYPSDGGDAQTLALVLRASDGSLLAVPLLGNVFLESQAQAVQWLADGATLTVDDRLAARPIDPTPDTYFKIAYTAIPRYVRACLPGWDILKTTILLCDLALCTQAPGEAFVAACEILKKRTPPNDWSAYEGLRSTFDKCSYWQEGSKFISDQIATWERDRESFPEANVLIERFRRACDARRMTPACMMSANYDRAWLLRVATLVGSPPIFPKDRHAAVRLIDDPAFEKTCFFVRGTYDLVHAMVDKDLREQCPLLKSKVCEHEKAAACREGHLLQAPRHNGKVCHIGAAAASLGIFGRAVERG